MFASPVIRDGAGFEPTAADAPHLDTEISFETEQRTLDTITRSSAAVAEAYTMPIGDPLTRTKEAQAFDRAEAPYLQTINNGNAIDPRQGTLSAWYDVPDAGLSAGAHYLLATWRNGTPNRAEQLFWLQARPDGAATLHMREFESTADKEF